MKEYIEREALKEVVTNLRFGKHLNKDAALNLMNRAIDNLSAADVVPMDFHERCLEIEIQKRMAMERKRGEWVDHMVRDWRCSECGEQIKKVRNVDGYCYDDKPNFCPNCGADMRSHQDSLCDQTKVIDISVNEPHLVCEVVDLKCHHRWIAAYPEKTLLKQLECQNCGAVGFVIKTGQEVDHA